MKLSLLFTGFSFLIFGFSQAHAEPKVCVYQIDMRNGKYKNTQNSDAPLKRVADFLVQKNMAQDCVGLGTKGMSSSGSSPNSPDINIGQMGISLMMNGDAMSKSTQKDLEKAVCHDAGPKCTVKTSYKCVVISSLKIRHNEPSVMRKKTSNSTVGRVGNIDRVPQFNDSCQDGDRNKSWQNAATSAESRQLLTDMGFVLSDIGSMAFLGADNQEIFTIGFMSPVAKTPAANQPTHPHNGTAGTR